MKFVILILNLIILNACGASKSESLLDTNKEPMKTEALSGNYTLNFLDSYKPIPTELTLHFEADTNRVSGFSGCNRFFGTYTVSGETITLGKMASTKMHCKRFMDVEQHMLRTLSKANTFSVENGVLTLLDGKTQLITATKEMLHKNSQVIDYTIEYSAVARGFYNKITLEQNTITTQKNHNEKPTSKTISAEKLADISDIVEDIDLKSLQNLEPPSKAHQYDGAAGATLKISHNGETYQTPTFDAGNPPKTIEALVTQLLSLSEKVE